jgi:hypothetical protein
MAGHLRRRGSIRTIAVTSLAFAALVVGASVTLANAAESHPPEFVAATVRATAVPASDPISADQAPAPGTQGVPAGATRTQPTAATGATRATTTALPRQFPSVPSSPVASPTVPALGQIPLLKPNEQLIFDGQSFNYSPWLGAKRTYPVQLLERLAARVGASAVTAISNTTYAQRASTVATRVDALYTRAKRTTVLDLAGQSDVLAGMPANAIYDAVVGYANARRAGGAAFVVEFTVPPSVLYSAAQDAERRAYNDLLLANRGPRIDAVVDIASRAEFADPSDTRYFIDGVHPTEAAAGVITSLALGAVTRLLG